MFTNQSLADLIEQHASPVPRYTSYPTALELQTSSDLQPVHQALKQIATKSIPISIYVHLPHCPSLCYFCACNKVISAKAEDRVQYLKNLWDEVALVKQQAGGKLQATQLHLGGGSPSYLEPDDLSALLSMLSREFVFTETINQSIEIDPRTFNREKAAVLGVFGFKRASLGVQDFDPKVQELVNRIQPLALTEQAVNLLVAQGIDQINFDLIYGLPGQTEESFAKTVAQVVAIKPSRIALYGYAHVDWKVKVQNVFNKHPRPDPHQRTRMFLAALESFEQAGYRYIGLDHFALPADELAIAQDRGQLRRNFMGYTTVIGAGVLALGVSAISDIEGVLFQNTPKIEEYQKQISRSILPVEKILVRSPEDRIRSWIIERIMCDAELNLADLPREMYDERIVNQITVQDFPRLREWEKIGLMTREGNVIKLNRIGRLFSRQIAAVFDAYLIKHQTSNKPKFSQGI